LRPCRIGFHIGSQSLASTEDGAVAIDASGRVVLHNPAASRVTGLAPDDARHRPWRDVLGFSDPVADLLWDVRTTGRPTRALADVLCAQGNLRPAEVVAHPWTEAGGRVGVLVLIRDLRVLCRHRTGPGGRPGYGSLVGADPAMESLYDLVEAVAPSDAPVVIEGEPGTGKELVAQLVHARSSRAERPLIAVDCAALAPATLETELFGQARNGVPGAGTVIGRVELAHTGTLFLDRVEDAPPGVQRRLHRLLETATLERGGETATRAVDVRVVASSNRPLAAAVRDGRFSAELLHRLQVVRIELPPLRRRRGDIPHLVEHFLARYGPAGLRLSDAAIAALQKHDWPGNVRQLENAVRQAIAARPRDAGAVLGPELFPRELTARAPGDRRERPPAAGDDRRTLLLRALSSHGGNRTAAARALGIGRATFYRWWRDAGLGGAPLA
jgi:PAS domain S-box-containing protein